MDGRIPASIVVLLVVFQGVAMAQTTLVEVEDYEDGDAVTEGWTHTGEAAYGTVSDGREINGNFSGATGLGLGELSRDGGGISTSRVAIYLRTTSTPGSTGENEFWINGSNGRIGAVRLDIGDDEITIFNGTGSHTIGQTIGTDEVWTVEYYNIDYQSETFEVKINDTSTPSPVLLGPYDFINSNEGFDGYTFRNTNSESFQIDDLQMGGELYSDQTPDISIEVDVNGYIPNGDTVPYEVTFNDTDGSLSDVTDQTSVTSQNTSLITVDESANTLTADDDNIGSTNVTFEYDSDEGTVTENVTIFVGPQTIANIGSMPSPQWIPSLLGVGEEGTWIGGVGSEFQWLIVLIIIVYGLTFVTNSATVGVGVGVGGIIALWVAGYVNVGMLLSVLLFGAFITLTTLDLQNDQTVVHEYR